MTGIAKCADVSRTAELFDLRPIELEGFTLRPRALVVVGRPKFDQWLAAVQFAFHWVGRMPHDEPLLSGHQWNCRNTSRWSRRQTRAALSTSRE